MDRGSLSLPKMDGTEISPGVHLIGEPAPVAGTNTLRCLAEIGGGLCIIELRIKFAATPPTKEPTP